MIFTASEMVKKYGSLYKVNLAVRYREIFKIKKGFYSDEMFPDPICVCSKCHPNSIINGEAALFLLGMTSYKPDLVSCSSLRGTTRFNDFKQHFEQPGLFGVGAVEVTFEMETVRVYGLERMVLETLRWRKKMDPAVVQDVIRYARANRDKINFVLLGKILDQLPHAIKLHDDFMISIM